MSIFKCKMCGGDLEVAEDIKIIECEYCGTKQTVPNADNEKKVNLFNRANRLRMSGEFDKASSIYESIVAEFPEESEAYWGLCLCNYGIEYVDDPATAKKIPTCHRASFESLQKDENFELALECADVVAQKIYRDEAREIDRIMNEILAVSKNEKPYDVFISYKETDEKGERTVDSVLAYDIYEALTAKGFNVFFARVTLEDKLGRQYEPYIFAALNSAKVMLSIGTKFEYFHAVWVKNEWSRFLKLMAKDKSKVLIPCFKDIDAYDMPEEFKGLQAQDMGKLGFIQDLTRGIVKIIHGSVEKTPITTSVPTGALTKRGYFFLEDGDFKSADEYFDKALDENPEDSKAYVGKVLSGLHMKDVTEIDDSFVKLYENKNFERAIRFASGVDKAQLEDIKENADRKWFVKRLNVALKKVANKKEADEILDEIKKLAVTATTEAYEKIISMCTDARNRRVSKNFTWVLVDSYTRQLDILRLLSSDYEEYTIEDIMKSKYFSGTHINLDILRDDVNRMIADGSVENGLTPNTYCLVDSTEKRILKKKENNYNHAIDLMTYAKRERNYDKYFAAAELFVSLNDFQNAEEKAVECKRHGEQLKAEVETERLQQEELHRQELARQEAERKAVEEKRVAEEKRITEEKRIADEKAKAEAEARAKKNKTIGAIVTSIVAVVLAVVIVSTTVIVPNGKYNEAVALMNDGKFIEAYESFIALGEHKDSKEKAESIYEDYKIEKAKQAQVGDYIKFGEYEQDANIGNGREEIEWLVLDKQDNKMLVVSKYCLDIKCYNENQVDTTWETSDLRKWLNGDFINSYFSDKEKEKISTVTLSVEDNPKVETDYGNATQDKIFVLSATEANKYFNSDNERTCTASPYLFTVAGDKPQTGVNCHWRLRSPGPEQDTTSFVYANGTIVGSGDYVMNVGNNTQIIGIDVSQKLPVRPAMWIEIG